MDIDKGETIKPIDPRKTPDEIAQDHAREIAGLDNPPISDTDFAEIQNKFDSTITIKTTKGSVCMNVVKQPPGQQWTICSPPYPQWW